MRKEPRAPARAKLNARQQHTLNARRMVPFVAKPALLLNLIWSRRKRKGKKKGWEKNYTQGNKYKVVEPAEKRGEIVFWLATNWKRRHHQKHFLAMPIHAH